MKELVTMSLGMAAIFTLIGCGAASKDIIYSKAHATRDGVFSEASQDAMHQKSDFVFVTISVSFKTHPMDFYLLEPKDSHHGGPVYPVIINIDGQGEIWPAAGRPEDTPRYDPDGKRIPDGGRGTRYSIEKRLKLKPGKHVIYLGFPDDEVSKEVELTVDPGEVDRLDLDPVYKKQRRWSASFYNGINYFDAHLSRLN